MSNPRLPLTPDEKAKLKKAKIKISEIHNQSTGQLSGILNASYGRTNQIKGLAEFQLVPSIGHKLAEKLVYQLQIFSLEEIKDKHGAALLDELEQRLGVWTDSCVEDQIRCVVAFANNPALDRQWFDFTDERKRYRERVGYPEERPKKAWYE
ncbi:helix-hairpin-helix domain-containing protein [Virgibacillus ihumii]|uniref:helix-hairpin-helix domain-containing protein n=1 Tax=Virgibacillus ihumii TaxID=2686091 RepID=UPI00157D6CEB|nr:helix-hairpin-helix domain-containing protein [Virgibacillus ihumii]